MSNKSEAVDSFEAELKRKYSEAILSKGIEKDSPEYKRFMTVLFPTYLQYEREKRLSESKSETSSDKPATSSSKHTGTATATTKPATSKPNACDGSKCRFISTLDLTEMKVREPLVVTKPSTRKWQRIRVIFEDYYNEFVQVYLDDMVVYSDTWNEHLVHLEKVFARMSETGLMIQKGHMRIAREDDEPIRAFIIAARGNDSVEG